MYLFLISLLMINFVADSSSLYIYISYLVGFLLYCEQCASFRTADSSFTWSFFCTNFSTINEGGFGDCHNSDCLVQQFLNYFVIYAFSLPENHDYVKFETNSHRTLSNQPF